MSTENALVSLLREGVSVQESSVDSKRVLEDALRMDVSVLACVGSFVVPEPVLKPKASVLDIIGCDLAYDFTYQDERHIQVNRFTSDCIGMNDEYGRIGASRLGRLGTSWSDV